MIDRLGRVIFESDTNDSLSKVKAIVSKIRDHVKRTAKPPTGNQNCQLCTWCTEAHMRGFDVLPRPVYSPRDPVFNIKGESIVKNPIHQSLGSGLRSGIENLLDLTEIKDGRWYCHVNWHGSQGGHEFILMRISKVLYVVDSQQGLVTDALSKRGGEYFNDINWGNSYIVRLDDKEFNEEMFMKNNDPSQTLPWNEDLDIPYMRENGMLPDEDINEAKVDRINDEGDTVPEKCDKCGSHVGLYLKGEPVWLCSNKKCGKYFGTAPCNFQESTYFMNPKTMEIINSRKTPPNVKAEGESWFEIDELAVPLVRACNDKGYVTRYCCSGHIQSRSIVDGKIYDDSDSVPEPYVVIDKTHEFKNLPNGWYVDDSSHMRYECTILRYRSKHITQSNQINNKQYLNRYSEILSAMKSLCGYFDKLPNNTVVQESTTLETVDMSKMEKIYYWSPIRLEPDQDQDDIITIEHDSPRLFVTDKIGICPFYTLYDSEIFKNITKKYNADIIPVLPRNLDELSKEENVVIKLISSEAKPRYGDFTLYVYEVDKSSISNIVHDKKYKSEYLYTIPRKNGDIIVSAKPVKVSKVHYTIEPESSNTFQESTLPDGVFLRPANESDLPNIIKWKLESVNPKTRNDPKTIRFIENDAKENLKDTKMIMSYSTVIGVLESCYIDDGEWWYIGEIYLIPEYRGKGIARVILQQEIDSHDKLKLRVSKDNTHAIDLYKSLGFGISEEDEYAYTMTLVKDNIQESESSSENFDKVLSACKDLYKEWSKYDYGIPVDGRIQNIPSASYFDKNYRFLSPEEFKRVGGGVCWDYVEFGAKFLNERGIKYKQLYIITDTPPNYETHTIIVCEVEHRVIYVESSFKKIADEIGGVGIFNSIEEVVKYITSVMFELNGNDKHFDKFAYDVIEFTSVPKYGSSCQQYMQWMQDHGEIIYQGIAYPRNKNGDKTIQEGAWNDIKNGINPYSTKRVFHISRYGHFDGQVFKPRVPEYLDKYDPNYPNFEDVENPRVCFSPSIEGCLNAIVVKVERWKADRFDKLYVYVPEKPIDQYKHTTNKQIIKDKKVYDANLTREVWIEEPVRLKMYGVIKVDQISDIKKKSTVPMLNGKKGERNYYSYKWHWLIKPKVLDKIPYDYSPTAVCEDMVRDLKRYAYGIPVNGKVQNVPSSEYFDKHYRLLSPDEFEKYGGGVCWDYVEFMEGYLDAYGYSCKKYYISTDTKDGDTHTFITVDDGKGGLLYPESSFKLIEGLHKVKNVEEAIKMIASKMFEVNNNSKKYSEIKYYVWEYSGHPEYGSNSVQCTEYFSKGEPFYEGTAINPNKQKIVKESVRMSYPDRFGNNTMTLLERAFMEADDDSDDNTVDLNSFGSDNDGSSPNNQYDEEEVSRLNELISDENHAVGQYFEAAKTTNNEVLRRLFSDIGSEERFHTEQLLYAKSTITGEKYEPMDKDVKKEYEELLAMGMDEEDAFNTAIDKQHLNDEDDGDDSDMEELEVDTKALGESFQYYTDCIELCEIITESDLFESGSEAIRNSMIVMESVLYMEEVGSIDQQKNFLKNNPITFIIKGFLSFIKFIKGLVDKIKIFISRIQTKQHRMHEWIKRNGIKQLFANGINMYFYDDRDLKHVKTSALLYCDMLCRIVKLIAKDMGLNFQSRFQLNNTPDAVQFDNVDDGLREFKKVVFSKTKIVVNENNEQKLAELFFGYSYSKLPTGKSVNIYHTLDMVANEVKKASEDVNNFITSVGALDKDLNSIYYKDPKKYRLGVDRLNKVYKGLTIIGKALASDMNEVLKLNNGLLEKTRTADANDMGINPNNNN